MPSAPYKIRQVLDNMLSCAMNGSRNIEFTTLGYWREKVIVLEGRPRSHISLFTRFDVQTCLINHTARLSRQ